MKIVSILENQDIEKRIAVTPETAKKYISLGIDVSLQKNYGAHLGFDDSLFKDLGVEIIDNEKDLFDIADIAIQLGLPADDKLSYLKENQSIIGVLNPYLNKKKIDDLIKKKNK